MRPLNATPVQLPDPQPRPCSYATPRAPNRRGPRSSSRTLRTRPGAPRQGRPAPSRTRASASGAGGGRDRRTKRRRRGGEPPLEGDRGEDGCEVVGHRISPFVNGWLCVPSHARGAPATGNVGSRPGARPKGRGRSCLACDSAGAERVGAWPGKPAQIGGKIAAALKRRMGGGSVVMTEFDGPGETSSSCCWRRTKRRRSVRLEKFYRLIWR